MITTIEELETLPVGSVIQNRHSWVLSKAFDGSWVFGYDLYPAEEVAQDMLPATLLIPNTISQAQVARIKKLHKRTLPVSSPNLGLHYEDPCPECDGKAGTHECGCWSDFDIVFVCAECHRLGGSTSDSYVYAYPCPTIQALGGDGE